MIDFFKKDRVKKAFEYMGKLSNSKPEELQAAQEKVTKLFSHDQLNKALELPGNQNSEGWRYAVRSYVLLKILTEYSGAEGLDVFAGLRKAEVKTQTEQMLQHVILQLLKILKNTVIAISGNVYVDVRGLEPKTTANIFHNLPPSGSKLWVPKGNWKLVPYKFAYDEIIEVDFETEKFDGIYTTQAANCCVCLFIYGGNNGIIKSVKLVHLSAGDIKYVPNWPSVTKDGLPSAVIFNTRDDPPDPNSDLECSAVGAIKQKMTSLGISHQKLTIHYAYPSTTNFGINKWGGFGDTNA